jgi:hypothetical protein
MNATSMNASKLLIQYKEGQRNFHAAALKQANLAWAKLPLIHLDEADLQKADLKNANLAGANLNHADFSSANLADINLMGAELIRAKLAGANLVRSLMSGANLSGANLRKTDLTNASLVGANLSGADFSGAILNNTNLSGANLKGANLSNTDLDNVDLQGLNLEETILSAAQSARIWESNHFDFDSSCVQAEEHDNLGAANCEQDNLEAQVTEVKLLKAPDIDPFALDPFLPQEEITIVLPPDNSPTSLNFEAVESPSVLMELPSNYKAEVEHLEKMLDADSAITEFSGVLELGGLHGSDEHLEMVAIANTEAVTPEPAKELFHTATVDHRNSRVVQSIQAVLQRRVQQSFQQALMEAYNYQCAITGCRIAPLLEATFIKRQEASDADHPSNGLILRTDLRNLYRLHLIAIDPKTLTVLTAPSLAGSDYRQLQGKPVFLPAEKVKRPDPKLLAEHLQACKWYSTPSVSFSEINSSAVVEKHPLPAFSQHSQRWINAVARNPKMVAIGAASLLVMGGTLWAGYNATRMSQAAKPQNNTPSISNSTAFPSLQGEVHPINVAIAAVTYPAWGIIANQTAYVPREVVEQLGVEATAVPVAEQATYQGKVYFKAVSLKPLGVELEWKAENRTMFLHSSSELDVQPINLQINGAWHPQAGLIIHQNAYLPVNLANQLSIDSWRLSASDRMQYANETYLKAAKLKGSQVALNWDSKTRTMALQNP